DEIEVRLKFRALNRKAIDNAALVDLLPGGFDLVLNPVKTTSEEGEGDEKQNTRGNNGRGANEGEGQKWRAPIGTTRSTWRPDYADLREDRVVLYGTVNAEFQDFAYRIKA